MKACLSAIAALLIATVLMGCGSSSTQALYCTCPGPATVASVPAWIRSWLTTPPLAVMVVVLAFAWSQVPLAAILLLAAVQAVPDDLGRDRVVHRVEGLTRPATPPR